MIPGSFLKLDRRRWRSLAALLPLLLLPQLAVAAEAPFLWRVERDGAAHALIGSVHLLPQDAYPLPAAVQRAFAAAQRVTFETDVDSLQDPAWQSRFAAGAGASQPLAQRVGPALDAGVRRQLRALSLPLSLCDALQAWACAVNLEIGAMERSGARADQGLDVQLWAQARSAHKAVDWFESPDQQIALFTRLPAATATQLLASTVDELQSDDAQPAALAESWRRNDDALLATQVANMQARFPLLYARLIGERNRAWADALAGDHSPVPRFVVVGAAHLVGEAGLPALLRARGFKVSRVRCGAGDGDRTARDAWCDSPSAPAPSAAPRTMPPAN